MGKGAATDPGLSGGGPGNAQDPAMTVAGLLGATPTVFAGPSAPVAAAPAAAGMTPDQQARIAAYRQQQESNLFNNLAGSGVSPETDSRFIAGSNQIKNLTDAEILGKLV